MGEKIVVVTVLSSIAPAYQSTITMTSLGMDAVVQSLCYHAPLNRYVINLIRITRGTGKHFID